MVKLSKFGVVNEWLAREKMYKLRLFVNKTTQLGEPWPTAMNTLKSDTRGENTQASKSSYANS